MIFGVSARRIVLTVTAGAVAVLAVLLVVLGWNSANNVATAASALAAVAGVGVAIWAALPAVSSGKRIRMSRTGRAIACGVPELGHRS